MQNYAKIWCYFEAIFRRWDEKFCLSKPRTTEGPRTREARTREGILYQISKNFPRKTEVRVVKRSTKFWHPCKAKITDLNILKVDQILMLAVVSTICDAPKMLI
jgi:hypothetical protein